MRAIKNARVQYQDQTLVRYERAVQDKLRNLMELLETGDAHLGFDKRVWIPDDTAEVEFTLMEGITDPIIVVNVRYQAGKGGGEKREKKKYYSPYLWVGIKAINHVESGDDANPNCGFMGYPVQPHLIGIEPHDDENPPTFLTTVNTATRRGPIGLEGYEDDELPLNDEIGTSNYSYSSEVATSGFFGDQSWLLTGVGFGAAPLPGVITVVARTENGMIATEFCATKLTLPPDALRPIADSEDPLPDNYWDRSIIVDPPWHVIFDDEEHENPIAFRHELPRDLGIDIECDFVPHQVPCEVQAGFYEIQAWAESFICECWGAELHMRMVLGKMARTEETVYDAETNATMRFIDGMEPNITVVDIYPQSVGNSNAQTRGYLLREILLGGQGACSSNGEFGSFNPARGFWQESLEVNVAGGTWRMRELRSVIPPMTDDSCAEGEWSAGDPCAGACDPGPFAGAIYAPATWDLGIPGGVAATLGQFTFLGPDGNFHHIDMLSLLAFHLARVTAINPINGNICGIQLVGNDGGAGNCGDDCKPFGYGTVFNSAKGTRNLPINDSYDPGTVVQGGWSVGELVVVTHAGGSAEPFGLGQTGLIVQPANQPIPGTGGMDPLSEFVAQTYRCPGGGPVENALEGYVQALSTRYISSGSAAGIVASIQCIGGRTVFVS